MSLQVWLQLDGDLENRGLRDISVINNGASIDDNGKTGKCYSFDGMDDYLEFSPKVDGLSEMSIAFWVYRMNSFGAIFSIERDTYWQLSLIENKLHVRDNSTGYNGTIKQFYINPIELNKWTHIALTYNRGTLSLYRNGSLENTFNIGGTTLNTGINNLRIGSTVQSGYYGFCKVNDFKLYDHCLSVKEVKETMKALVLHYALNQEEELIYDLSGHDNHASATGDITLSDDTTKYDKCFYLRNNCSIVTDYVPNINNDSVSFGGWFKLNRNEINDIMSSYQFDSIHHSACGNLVGNNNYGGIGIIWKTNDINYDNGFTSISLFGSIKTNTIGYNLTGSFLMDFDTWTHIFLTYDKKNNMLSIYKNGTKMHSTEIPSFSDAPEREIKINSNDIVAGDGPGMILPMKISDIRAYAECLSDEDINNICFVSASIDRQAAMYTLDYVETENNTIKIRKTGVTNSSEIVEKNNDDGLGDDIDNASFNKQGTIKSKRFYEN